MTPLPVLFFQDIRRECNYQSPCRFGSRVWIRIWQRWSPDFCAGPWVRRYLFVILAPVDFIDRLYHLFVRYPRNLRRWNKIERGRSL